MLKERLRQQAKIINRLSTSLYYECHITIDPVFDEALEKVKFVAKQYEFRVADLLMKKRAEDAEFRPSNDTFITGRDTDYILLEKRMRGLIAVLIGGNIKVRRYKIEDTLLDSHQSDSLNLIVR